MAKKYVVRLSAADRTLLTDLITAGTAAARARTHARILLKADQGPDWIDLAQVMRDLVDVYFPDAERIALVLDILNTRDPASLYQVFAPAEVNQIRDMIHVHPTPKHAVGSTSPKPGSWLPMWLRSPSQCSNHPSFTFRCDSVCYKIT